MHNRSDKGDERQPEPGVARGSTDPREDESALAREFAQRALAPIVSDLRGRSGWLEGKRVASAVGMRLDQLASCLELPEEELRKSPPPEFLEARLEPFAMVIGVVRDVYGGDGKRLHAWLRTSRPELGGQTPLDAMCIPGGIQRVIHFVLSAWLGNAD
ncbi:MAG TPA: MbcA/ParS/Xre antitoxin family protein [Gemmatimonadaceae bacterium]